jgi:hypothetical protein
MPSVVFIWEKNMGKTIKLKFSQDAYFNGELAFEKEKVYEVETANGWADRWIRRGAVEVDHSGEEMGEKPEEIVESSKEASEDSKETKKKKK